MAAFDTTRSPNGGFFDFGRITSVVTRGFGAIISWNDARITRHSLANLTDAELDDIGLCRGDIYQTTRRRA